MMASNPAQNPIAARAAQSPRQAVERLRELVLAGDFDAQLAVDKHSGELVRPEVRGLLAALPPLSPACSPEELLEHGLVSTVPPNLRRASEAPRYRVGREVFVKTNVMHHQADKHRPVGAFDANAKLTFTHRARLRLQSGDSFLVELEGAPRLLSFAKADVFAWNEPTTLFGVLALSGVQIDANDPLLKAHICAAALSIANELGSLDLARDDEANVAVQARLVHRIAARVQMSYVGRGEGYSGARAGALMHGGQGVSFVQRAVAAALLAPFARLLGFDLQVANGRTLRLGVPHGFLVVTLRPSLRRYVIDPAWGEPLTDLRVAFFGPGWGHDRRLEGFEGQPDVRVRPESIDLPEATS